MTYVVKYLNSKYKIKDLKEELYLLKFQFFISYKIVPYQKFRLKLFSQNQQNVFYSHGIWETLLRILKKKKKFPYLQRYYNAFFLKKEIRMKSWVVLFARTLTAESWLWIFQICRIEFLMSFYFFYVKNNALYSNSFLFFKTVTWDEDIVILSNWKMKLLF